MIDCEYYEEVPLQQWVTVALGLFIVVITPTFVLEYFAVSREPSLLWLYLVMDGFFLVTLLNFRKMSISIQGDILTVSFGLIKKHIRLDSIRRCEIINARLSVFTGMGIRYGGDGSLAYLPRLGEAIRLEFESGRPFVFSSNNCERILELLNQYCQ